MVITEKIQYALETLGMNAYSRPMIVVTTPSAIRMCIWMPSALTCWKYRGRYPCSRPIFSRPFEGPASQATMPLSDAVTSAMAVSGTSTCSPKWAKKALNACITPAVRLSCWDGITHEMVSAGTMKMARTSPTARRVAFGNSPAGSRNSSTWTAFISIPAYARKLLTISTTPASPVQAGRRCVAFIGAAEWLPWIR